MPYHRLEELKQAINASSSWVEVALAMGRDRKSGDYFKRLAIKNSLDYSNLNPSHMTPLNKEDFKVPFKERKDENRLSQRRAAIGTAINWFLSNGYSPSLPVEVEKYDLVVESPTGFQKVQVKSSEKIASNGNHEVSLLTTYYNTETNKYEQRSYTEDEIDVFFVECLDGTKYIIPYAAVEGKQRITITKNTILLK
jgi:hypothetical protein